MRFDGIAWDDWSIDHIARHGVTPQEVEEACFNKPLIRKGPLPRYFIFGQTDAGRYLTIIIEPVGKRGVQIITARDMSATERRNLIRR